MIWPVGFGTLFCKIMANKNFTVNTVTVGGSVFKCKQLGQSGVASLWYEIFFLDP